MFFDKSLFLTVGFDVTDKQIKLFELYFNLIKTWNKTINLVSFKNDLDLFQKHFYDCIIVRPFILEKDEQLLDMGSGAGFPGLVLAILLPEKQFYLVDSTEKKTNFLKYVVFKLDLKNVVVLNSRIEKLSLDFSFDVILSRAFSSVASILRLSMPLLIDGGRVLAMRGKMMDGEVDLLSSFGYPFLIEALDLKRILGDRNLILVSKGDEVKCLKS